MQLDSCGNGLPLVITRGYSNFSHVAFAIDITIGLGMGHDAATGSDEAGGAVNRSTSGIGDLSFQAIAIIRGVVLVGLRDLKLDIHVAASIKSAFALLDHIIAGTVILRIFVSGVSSLASYIRVLFAITPRVVTRAIDVVVNAGIGDGCSKEITRVN